MEKVKTLEDAKQLLTEYDALPDIDAKLNWGGRNRLPTCVVRCSCGRVTTHIMNLDEIRDIIEFGREWKLEYNLRCWGHDDEGEENETEDEE